MSNYLLNKLLVLIDIDMLRICGMTKVKVKNIHSKYRGKVGHIHIYSNVNY